MMRWGRKGFTRTVLAAGGMTALVAGGMIRPARGEETRTEAPPIEVQIPPDSVPASRPAPASFDAVLGCMDGLLQGGGIKNVHITVVGLPDLEGKMVAGRDTMAGALLAMSANSQAFQVIDFDSSQSDLTQLFADTMASGASTLVLPTYYVRGTATNTFAPARPGFAMAVQTLDLHVGLTETRIYVPGTTTRLTLTLFEPDGNGVMRGRVDSRDGWSVEDIFATPRHFSEPVEALVDLGLVELLGKLAHVPYRDCLSARE
ncbi:MAG: hypothetical protein FD149_1385 [Rhodospirillaceae bacterium]|nr:MAG: hypothetical protein FD149_1385 [Rhodospirillaceae bacterium]